MKTIAWNVDTQYDFMRADGKLYVQDAEKIEENLEKLTKLFRNNDITIVNTGDWHNENTAEISANPDYINTFPEHCMQNTFGAEYVNATKPSNALYVDWQDKSVDLEAIAGAKEIVLYKDMFDVFTGNPHTESVLEKLNPERLIVYGVATNVCVDYAVKGHLARGTNVYVVEDAIKALPNIPSPVNDWVKSGAKLIKTENAIEYIGGIETSVSKTPIKHGGD